jgi:hypothetical protein
MTPKVKKLEWVAVEEDRGDGVSDLTGGWTADTEIGLYVIDIGWGSDGYYWSVQSPDGFDIGSDFDDLIYAQESAQADYSARIIAALDPAWLAALEAQVKAADGLADHLTWILPMAKGYAHANPHDVNNRLVAGAEEDLAAYRAAKDASHA